jgi:acyl-phosphate glycerol 3-phosphate acyltransferase
VDLLDLQTPWFYALWALGVYLLASLSPGDLVSRWVGVDIRSRGTGNPGAVNIYKEVGPRHGITVLALDLLIGAVATVPLYLLEFPGWVKLLAVAAVLGGHIFPVFWRFNGGAGGAVAMGVAFGLLPLGALVAAAVTGLVLALARTPIYSVWLFFGVTLLAGGLLHRDIVGLVGVLLAVAAPTVKFLSQSRIRSMADLKRALGM